MLTEETVRETRDQRVEPFLEEGVAQVLRDWQKRIYDRASDLSVTTSEAMQLGTFACIVGEAADAVDKLHRAYEEPGSIGPDSTR